VTFPFGLFDWTISDLTPGATVVVNMFFQSLVPMPPQYWKFNAGTGLWTDVCLQLQCAVDPSSPNVLQLTITDGGVGDLDGIANGMIRDPGGLGVSEASPDRTPPTTVATLSPAPNAAGWNNTDVTVKLVPQDEAGGSGVKELHFAFSGAETGGAIARSGSLPLVLFTTFSVEGTTIETYFAVDNAGNQEAPQTVTVRIDKTPPTATFGSPSPAPNAAAGTTPTSRSPSRRATRCRASMPAGAR